MSGDVLGQEFADGVLTLTLNRPDRLNAINQQLTVALTAAITSVGADTRAIVLTGAGRAFSSGADLQDAGELIAAPEAVMASTSAMIRSIVECPKPIVVRLNGLAAGVAAGIVVVADLVVAAESAYLLLPFTGIGLIPDGGTTYSYAAAAGRSAAMRYALTGERMPAATARDLGLISHVCPDADLDTRTGEVLAALRKRAPEALALTKAAINEASLPGLSDALDRESRVQTARITSDEFAEGATAFVQGRPPRWSADARKEQDA